MALLFNYKCDGCGRVLNNHELGSFVCSCSGIFTLVDKHLLEKVPFDTYFNDTLGCEVGSWSDLERKAKKCKSVKHKDGFHIVENNSKFMKEMRNVRKHREDYVQETYKKSGIDYKPGSNFGWSESKKSFIRRGDDPRNPSRPGRVYSFARGS